MVDRVALVMRAEGWVCDSGHEPVSRWGQCRDCDWLHRRTARAIVEGVLWPAVLSPYRPRLPRLPHEEIPGQTAIIP